jgi:hypothetical protein
VYLHGLATKAAVTNQRIRPRVGLSYVTRDATWHSVVALVFPPQTLGDHVVYTMVLSCQHNRTVVTQDTFFRVKLSVSVSLSHLLRVYNTIRYGTVVEQQLRYASTGSISEGPTSNPL